jgi:hypothetical protein
VEWTGDDAAETRVFPSVRLRDVFVEVEEEEVAEGLFRDKLEEVAGRSLCRSRLSSEWADGRNALLSEASGHCILGRTWRVFIFIWGFHLA